MSAVRDTYMSDYGITPPVEKKIISCCKNAKGEDLHMLLDAAINVNPCIAKQLFFNLSTGVGYDRIGNIPMQRKDFQGYRRKAIDEYYRYLLLKYGSIEKIPR